MMVPWIAAVTAIAVNGALAHYIGYRAGYNRGYDDSRQARGRWRFWLAGPPDWTK